MLRKKDTTGNLQSGKKKKLKLHKKGGEKQKDAKRTDEKYHFSLARHFTVPFLFL